MESRIRWKGYPFVICPMHPYALCISWCFMFHDESLQLHLHASSLHWLLSTCGQLAGRPAARHFLFGECHVEFLSALQQNFRSTMVRVHLFSQVAIWPGIEHPNTISGVEKCRNSLSTCVGGLSFPTVCFPWSAWCWPQIEGLQVRYLDHLSNIKSGSNYVIMQCNTKVKA